MSAVLSAVADRPFDDSIDATDASIPRPEGAPATKPPATKPPATKPPATKPPATEPPATEPHDGRVPDAGIAGEEERDASEPDTIGVDDLSRGACGARIDGAVNQRLRSELSGYEDESEVGDDDSPGGVNKDDDDLDEFDEIDEDDFDDEFDDDFEEELEDEYEIEIEDEISAEFGLGPDKEDEEEELDDLDSLADDLDEDIDDDVKD